MDIATLVPLVVSTVVPLLQKGAEKTAEAGFEQRGKIWSPVKGMFVEDGLTLLNLFEQNPADAKTQGKLEGKLEERLKDNSDVLDKLHQLIEQLKEIEKNSPSARSSLKNRKRCFEFQL